MDRQGKKLVHCNVKNNDFPFFLKLIDPYKHNLTVGARECMFGWYWLVDACQGSQPDESYLTQVIVLGSQQLLLPVIANAVGLFCWGAVVSQLVEYICASSSERRQTNKIRWRSRARRAVCQPDKRRPAG